jgi:hypothetical protein
MAAILTALRYVATPILYNGSIGLSFESLVDLLQVATLQVVVVMTTLPQVAVDIEAAGYLLPEAHFLVRGMK